MGYGDTENSNDNGYSSTSGNPSGQQQGGSYGQQNTQPPANDNIPPAYTPPAYTPPGAEGTTGPGDNETTGPGGGEEESPYTPPGGEEEGTGTITGYDFEFEPDPPPTPTLPNVLEGFTHGVVIYDHYWDGFSFSHQLMNEIEAFNWALSQEIPYQYMPITLTALEPSISGVELEPITVFIDSYDSQLGADPEIGLFTFVDVDGNIGPWDWVGDGVDDMDWSGIHFGFELPIYNWMANPVTEVGLNALATDQYVYQYETEIITQYVGSYHKHLDNTLVIDIPTEPMDIGHRHELHPQSIIIWSDEFVPKLPPVPFETIQDVKEAVSDTFYKLFFENDNVSVTGEDIRKSQTTIRDGKQKTGRQEDEQLVFYKKDRNTLESRKALRGYHFDAICEYLYHNHPELTYNDLLNNYHEYFELIIEEEIENTENGQGPI